MEIGRKDERERGVFYETPPGGFVRKLKPKFITLT